MNRTPGLPNGTKKRGFVIGGVFLALPGISLGLLWNSLTTDYGGGPIDLIHLMLYPVLRASSRLVTLSRILPRTFPPAFNSSALTRVEGPN